MIVAAQVDCSLPISSHHWSFNFVNGLTKALSKNGFNDFIRQVNLVDITDQITKRRVKEMQQDELDHNGIQILMGDEE